MERDHSKINTINDDIGLDSGEQQNISLTKLYMNQQNFLKQLREQIRVLASDTYRNERIYYGIAYCIIVIVSFFGNLLVCKICFKKRTKTNALILSLAVSDLLMTVFNIPFNFFRIANFSWPFGSAMCFVVNFVQHLVVYISSYTMAIIAIQRYQSITGFRSTSTSHVNNKPTTDINVNDNHNNRNIFSMCSNCLRVCLNTFFVPFRCLKNFCSFQENEALSLKTIYVTIIITWCCSAFLSLLFTYSSEIVIREDASYLLEIFVREKYTNNPNTTAEIAEASVINHNESNSYLKHVFQDQQQINTNNLIKRCRNSITENVQKFFDRNFSIKADIFITIIIFVTQYFIPLAIICYLYVKIGKIIYKQGKLCNDRGNAKARIRQRKKLRRMLMLILMVAVFALCWLPLHIFHILIDAGLLNYNYRVFMMVHWLAMSSVSYNPFIYCWLNKSFRKAALSIFCCGGSGKNTTNRMKSTSFVEKHSLKRNLNQPFTEQQCLNNKKMNLQKSSVSFGQTSI